MLSLSAPNVYGFPDVFVNYTIPVKEEVMTRMIFVNLPVGDLAASTAFYVALGGR